MPDTMTREARSALVSPEYVAGFVDGEGHLGINKHKNRRPSPSYDIIVDIGNTVKAPLLAIQERYGGSIRKEKRMAPNKDCYRLKISTDHARRMLIDIRDYLLIKRPQADVLLKFRYYKMSIRHFGNRRLLEADLEMRERFHKDVMKMNKKGRPAPNA